MGNLVGPSQPTRSVEVTTPQLIYIYVLVQGLFTWYVTLYNLGKNIYLNASISFTYNSRQNLNLAARFFFLFLA